MSVAVAAPAVMATFFIFAAEIFVFYGYYSLYYGNSHSIVFCCLSNGTQA